MPPSCPGSGTGLPTTRFAGRRPARSWDACELSDLTFGRTKLDLGTRCGGTAQLLWRQLYLHRYGEQTGTEAAAARAPINAWKVLYAERTTLQTNWRRGRFDLRPLVGHTGRVHSLHLTRTRVLTAGHDGTVRSARASDRCCGAGRLTLAEKFSPVDRRAPPPPTPHPCAGARLQKGPSMVCAHGRRAEHVRASGSVQPGRGRRTVWGLHCRHADGRVRAPPLLLCTPRAGTQRPARSGLVRQAKRPDPAPLRPRCRALHAHPFAASYSCGRMRSATRASGQARRRW